MSAMNAPVALVARALRPVPPLRRGGSGRAVPLRRLRSATTKSSYAVAVAPPGAVAFQGAAVSLAAWTAEAAGRASTALLPWTDFLSPQVRCAAWGSPA